MAIKSIDKLAGHEDGAYGVVVAMDYGGKLYLSSDETRELIERLKDMFPERFEEAS